MLVVVTAASFMGAVFLWLSKKKVGRGYLAPSPGVSLL